MRAIFAPMPVGDYCSALNDEKVIVNEDYQRNDGLWTAQARSFFIESILLEYPIPKIYLYAVVDLSSRTTVKEIVDGQQRSSALKLFYNNRIRLSAKIETERFRGKKYNQLDDEDQTRFLSYQLPIDQFSGVPESEVREAFRRMNSSNVPLNEEEQRNAKFQGPFKWFIHHLGQEFNSRLFALRLFSKRDLVRMSDSKTYADIAFVIDHGFATTKAPQLDALYRKYNASFDDEERFLTLISSGIESFLAKPSLHQPPLLKSHIFQTIVLILIARQNSQPYDEIPELAFPDTAARVAAHRFTLDDLVAALVDPQNYPELGEFTSSTLQKTNVAEARMIRYIYFKAAI